MRIMFLVIALMVAPAVAQTTASAEINLRQTVTVNVVRDTKDAVVNISTTKMIPQRFSRFGRDPFWQFMEPDEIVNVPASSLGSGFIIHEDGYVVTNHHVIDRARHIDVELSDGRKIPAELISSDAEADLAILKISSDKPLPVLPLGDSSDLLIGEPVIAVGNPLGFSHSVSTGIVSAIHRDLRDQRDQVLLSDLVQTDAAINPGNSGGPLLNAYGQVIGINTAIRGDAQNIGFAIQVNRLRDLIPDLMNPAQVRKVEIGLRITEKRTITPPANVKIDLSATVGDKTFPLDTINGKSPRDVIDAYAMLLRTDVDQSVELRAAGSDQAVSLPATAVPLPDAIVQARQRLGITIEPLTPMLAERYDVEAEDGMFITQVERDSIAARAGLQPGDVIVQLGRYRVSSLDDFSALLQHLPDRGRVRVGVVRGKEVGFGILEL